MSHTDPCPMCKTFTVTLVHTTYEVVEVLTHGVDDAMEIALGQYDDNTAVLSVNDDAGEQVWHGLIPDNA